MTQELRKPVTTAEWDAMAPEEQDALIASGWHPGPGAYSDRALQVRYARRDRDFWKVRAEAAEAEVRQLREAQSSLLAEQVRLTEGLRRIEREGPNHEVRAFARAILAASPPDGGGA